MTMFNIAIYAVSEQVYVIQLYPTEDATNSSLVMSNMVEGSNAPIIINLVATLYLCPTL
jgi:hypothetical protein